MVLKKITVILTSSCQTDEEVTNEVTDTRNELVPSTSNQSFHFHRTSCAGLRGAGLCGGCYGVQDSFALFRNIVK